MDERTANVYGDAGHTPYVTPVTEERATYNEILRFYRNHPADIAILPSQLRSEQALSDTRNSFAFNVRVDQPNPGLTAIRSTENRLDINDAFVVMSMSVQFGIELIASTTPGAVIPQTWDNPAAYSATGGGGFGAASAALTEAYNGQLGMTVNTVQYMSGLDMGRFKSVGTAQGGVLSAVAGPYAQSEYGNKKGFSSVLPTIRLQGGDKTQFVCTLPEAANFGALATYRIVPILLLNGWRIQNGGGQRSR